MVTAEWLRENGVYSDTVTDFVSEWPNGAEVTEKNLIRAVELGFDLEWFAKKVLPIQYQAEFEFQTKSLLPVYQRKIEPFLVELNRKIEPFLVELNRKIEVLKVELNRKIERLKDEPLYDEFHRLASPLRTAFDQQASPLYNEFELQTRLFRDEYDRLQKPLWAEYSRQVGTAFWSVYNTK